MTIADRLKKERQSKRMTQSELAKVAGVSVTSQKHYEAGRRVPDADYLEKVEDVVDTVYVLTGKRVQAGEDVQDYEGFEWNPELFEQAKKMAAVINEEFAVPEYQKKEVPFAIYAFLKIGNFGTSLDDMRRHFEKRMPWAKK